MFIKMCAPLLVITLLWQRLTFQWWWHFNSNQAKPKPSSTFFSFEYWNTMNEMERNELDTFYSLLSLGPKSKQMKLSKFDAIENNALICCCCCWWWRAWYRLINPLVASFSIAASRTPTFAWWSLAFAWWWWSSGTTFWTTWTTTRI